MQTGKMNDAKYQAVSKTREFVGRLMYFAGVDESFSMSNIPKKTLGIALVVMLGIAMMMAESIS